VCYAEARTRSLKFSTANGNEDITLLLCAPPLLFIFIPRGEIDVLASEPKHLKEEAGNQRCEC